MFGSCGHDWFESALKVKVEIVCDFNFCFKPVFSWILGIKEKVLLVVNCWIYSHLLSFCICMRVET